MSKVILALFAAATFCLACGNGAGKDATAGDAAIGSTDTSVAGRDTTVKPADTALSGCYTWINKRDTASLQLDVKGANITGPLSYRLFEKDRNEGTFQGALEGDKIIGWYLFRSEGRMSVRQVAWKIGGQKLIEGTGDVVMRGDTAAFRSLDNLVFDSSMSFKKIPCMM